MADKSDNWDADYNDIGALVRHKTEANVVVVVVVDGKRGSGFSVRVRGQDLSPDQAYEMLPGLLRAAVDRGYPRPKAQS